MLVSIVLLIFMVFSLASFILLFPFELYQYAIIPFIILCIFILMFRMWFYHRCRKYINLNKNIIDIKKFIQTNDKNEANITFYSHGDIYLSRTDDSIIEFNLKGFALKKSFIRAFVVRQIRYKAVSKKLKISKLFSINLKCDYKYDKLYLIINGHKSLIFSNGISKNTLLSSEISKAKFAAMYSSHRAYSSSNAVEEMNEKIYLDYYKFYRDF